MILGAGTELDTVTYSYLLHLGLLLTKPRGVVPTKEFSTALKLLKFFLKVADADGYFLGVIIF